MFAFPWGEPGTILEGEEGPETWQRELLGRLRDKLITPFEAIREAIASGHGVGKSTFVAWIILWGMSTFEDTRIVLTANTESQLMTKTWPELTKWYNMCITRHWFVLTATSLFSKQKGHEKNWRTDLIPWNETKTEAFAGMHNYGKRILMIMDEASAIPDPIWEVIEGALTDALTEILWLVFGNPTRNSGRFFDCFNSLRHRWHCTQVDSRTVSRTDKKQIAEWQADYGEDSDFFRIRVRGVFPRAGSVQFISNEIVTLAINRPLVHQHMPPLVIGVDVAGFGDDQTVFYPRLGLDARSFPPKSYRYRGLDTVAVCRKVMELLREFKAVGRTHNAICVDAIGIGFGVVSVLKDWGVPRVFGIESSESSPDPEFANVRAWMWGLMKKWLKEGGCLADDRELEAELTTIEYNYNVNNRILLEKVRDLKKRGLPSPDTASALALTFAVPAEVAIDQDPSEIEFYNDQPRVISDYDPYSILEHR